METFYSWWIRVLRDHYCFLSRTADHAGLASNGCTAERGWSNIWKGDINRTFRLIIMGNMRSLGNKMEELTALARRLREYRECSLMCFTSTWLQVIPDENTIESFQTMRAVRIHRQCSKKQGGIVAVFANNRWCNPGHIKVKESVCSPNIETFGRSTSPILFATLYVIVVAAYIPPCASYVIESTDPAPHRIHHNLRGF